MNHQTMRLVTALICILLAAAVTNAKPAKPGKIRIIQPDGTTFTTTIKGDEWYRVHTTEDGKAVIKDSDGWWKYAIYDDAGGKRSTGYHVGKSTPQAVLNQSMIINTGAMKLNAMKKREEMQRNMQKKPILKSIAANSGTEVKRGLVILAAFADVPFTYSSKDFLNSMNLKEGSAKEYFNDQFGGMYDFEFDVSPIVTLTGNRKWYGENDRSGQDKRPAEMVEEACRLAREAGIDFSLYDMDSDGEVDNVHVFYAGGDESEGEGDDCIWAHQWNISTGAGLPKLELDGKIIDRYSCSSELSRPGYSSSRYEMAGIGAFCHEYSHTLGLPDFYDTDYEENGWSAGLWSFTSVMDGGCYNNNSNTPPYYNVIEREILGLVEPVIITEGMSCSMDPIHESGKCYRMETDTKNEYYLFECRAAEGWDKYIGGAGMLVYHIDKTNSSIWDIRNTVNSSLRHQCADLIEADGRKDDYSAASDDMVENIGGIFYPYGKNTTLSAGSSPALKFWSGAKCPITIKDIARNGKAISFTAVGKNTVTPPKPVDVKFAAFTDAVLINFNSSTTYEGDARIRCYTDTWEKTITVSPYEKGKYSVTIDGLSPNATTYKADIWFEIDEMKGTVVPISFMTKTLPETEWPYIYLNYASRGEDGSFVKGSTFPLRVNNASKAEKITWKFKGVTISPKNGYFTVSGSGTLKAEIYFEDGSKSIIIKEITAK